MGTEISACQHAFSSQITNKMYAGYNDVNDMKDRLRTIAKIHRIMFVSYTAYPELASDPRLTGPFVEDDLYVMFYCAVNLTTTDNRARVKFWFYNSNFPEQIVTAPPYKVALHEKHLAGRIHYYGVRSHIKEHNTSTLWSY